jgi:hypothetical protein
MSIVRIMMLDAEGGVPKHSYCKKRREERPERSYIVMPRTFQGRWLVVEKTGKKVSNLLSSLLLVLTPISRRYWCKLKKATEISGR